jgi:sporulation protein YlmC with PRC-barrel domain
MTKQVQLGARVRAIDGDVGTVAMIVVDPGGRRPGYLVVKHGRIPPRQRQIVVPVGLVEDVTPDEVILATTREALHGFPDYEITVQKGIFEKPVPTGGYIPTGTYTPSSNDGYMVLSQRSVPEHTVGVEQGMTVMDAAGVKVGYVHGLILNSDSRQASYLVLRYSRPLTMRILLIPVDLVADVKDGEIHLYIADEHMYGLELYLPSSEPLVDGQEAHRSSEV